MSSRNDSNDQGQGQGQNGFDDEDFRPIRRSDSSTSISFLDVSKLLLVNDFDFGWNINNVGDTTKKKFNDKFNEMKSKTRQKLNKYGGKKRKDDLIKFTENFNQQLTKFDHKVHQHLQSSATEKAFYAMAISTIAMAGFLIGKYPTWFPLFHTVLFCLLMPIRFYTYFKLSYNYYLADLCYYVNLLVMLFIWVFPQSPTLFTAVFSLSLGTLSFAVITWRNSLVLHSIEKTTSSFIHIMPPISLFVIVHELPKDYLEKTYSGVAKVDHWKFGRGIMITSIFYTIWQVSYHYFITIRKKDKILRGKVTSFSHLKESKKDSVLGRFVNGLPYNWMQIMAFTLIQFGYQLLTMVFCPIWFKYKHICGLFVSFIFMWASYNGATYYIDIFGKRFEKEVEKLKNEVKELQLANEKLQYSPLSRPESFIDTPMGSFRLDESNPQSHEGIHQNSDDIVVETENRSMATSTGVDSTSNTARSGVKKSATC
jgi:hypothetical protein